MTDAAPVDFELLQAKAGKIIAPLRPVDGNSAAKKDFLFSAKRAIGAFDLPAPYLIYFLLVDLLKFKNLGRSEKLAWSIPVDFNGKAFLIEHRKFGVGIFIQEDEDLDGAKEISTRIEKGVQCAEPYFKWKAAAAVAASKFNVSNNSRELFGRFYYLAELRKTKIEEAERRKNEVVETKFKSGSSYARPYFGLKREGTWLAIAAIESFFGWTEHAFVLFAILNGEIQTGEKFSEISGADWNLKFKAAFDVSNREFKMHYDRLIQLRREVRNFVAHGGFGKGGETLHFHSSAGAVPVSLNLSNKRATFSLGGGIGFDEDGALLAIESFVASLKTGSYEPAWLYVHEFELPLIMTMAQDGSYRDATKSTQSMSEFAEFLSRKLDNAANMDW